MFAYARHSYAFFTGGLTFINKSNAVNNVTMISTSTNTVSSGPPMRVSRGFHAAVWFHSVLSRNSFNFQALCAVDVIELSCSAAVFRYKNGLLICGDINNKTMLHSCEYLPVGASHWQSFSPLFAARASGCLVVFGDDKVHDLHLIP